MYDQPSSLESSSFLDSLLGLARGGVEIYREAVTFVNNTGAPLSIRIVFGLGKMTVAGVATLREGRGENLEVLLSTQFPKDCARIVRNSVTEWGLVNTVERDELDVVRPYFPGMDRAADVLSGQGVDHF